LAYAQRENVDLEPGQQPELAHELAENAARLEDENFDKAAVAEATLEAVRSLRGQIEDWKNGDQSEKLRRDGSQHSKLLTNRNQQKPARKRLPRREMRR